MIRLRHCCIKFSMRHKSILLSRRRHHPLSVGNPGLGLTVKEMPRISLDYLTRVPSQEQRRHNVRWYRQQPLVSGLSGEQFSKKVR